MVNHGLFLRDALEAVAWIDEDNYVFYKADGDLCLRLWDAGYRIVDVPGAFIEHFFDANEAVRLQNNETLEHDKKIYATRWKRLALLSTVTGNMGKVALAYEDPERTAEQHFS